MDNGPNGSSIQGFIEAYAQHKGDSTEESVLRLTTLEEVRENFKKNLGGKSVSPKHVEVWIY